MYMYDREKNDVPLPKTFVRFDPENQDQDPDEKKPIGEYQKIELSRLLPHYKVEQFDELTDKSWELCTEDYALLDAIVSSARASAHSASAAAAAAQAAASAATIALMMFDTKRRRRTEGEGDGDWSKKCKF